MSWLTSWMHPERGYKAAQEQLNKYYNESKGYQQPYNEQGIGQAANLNEYINSLMNPEELYDKWSSGYKESDAAKNMEKLATQHGLDAASSMGLLGSNTALNAVQAGTSGIMANDKQSYLNDMMEKYKTGAGLSQGMYNTGAQAGANLGQGAMKMGEDTAGLKFNEVNAPGQMFGGLSGEAVKSLLSYLTGGYGTGGFGRGAWNTGGS